MRAWLLIAALSSSACGSCKKKSEPPPPPAPGSASASSASQATLFFEKFVDAHPVDGGVEVAAIMRDRTLAIVSMDASLTPKKTTVLARDVEAVEGTDVSLAGGLVVATAKIGGTRGTWLLRENAAPRAIGLERCELRDGFAWLERDGESTRIKAARTNGEVESPVIVVPADREAHVTCGTSTVVLSTRDGENLSVATWGLNAPPSPLTEAEKEGVLEDELRERLVLVRENGDVVMLRVGDKTVQLRDGGDWQKLTVNGKPFVLADDVDVIEGAVAANAKGKIFMLASEPAQGSCADGDPPRRVVLYTIDGLAVTSHPVIELPCGAEAIAAHLSAETTRARMWWTEPVDAKTCNQKGLPIAAVVTAASDGPAKRIAVLAEGVAQVDTTRFVAVTRPGGCVAYEAAGNGVLTLVK